VVEEQALEAGRKVVGKFQDRIRKWG